MAVKVYRDKRVKLTGKDYTAHKQKVWEAQDKRCFCCGWFLPFKFAELDHYAGRGMGGGRRHDTDERNRIVCHDCHFNRHWQERDCAARVR